MQVSDWVHTNHNMNKITGFIESIEGQSITIFVTIPSNYGTIVMNNADICMGDDLYTPFMQSLCTLVRL